MHSRLPPTFLLLVLTALAVFLGCSTPILAERPAYLNSPRLAVPAQAIDASTVFVRTLGIRPAREDGGDLRIDVMLRGQRAWEVARRWTAAPSNGGDANAVISLRRTHPQPRPFSLSFSSSGITAAALDRDGNDLYRAVGAEDPIIMLTLHLETEGAWTTGTYDLMLQVPQTSQAAPWDVADITIHLDQKVQTVEVTDTKQVPLYAR